ncbi:MAG: response regulator [Candidatus Melainabacteria bacterium]
MADPQKTILILDDEPNILRSIQRSLRKEKMTILTATTAAEALQLMEDNEVQVVISDYMMPQINGIEFLEVVKHQYPLTVRVMFSGYADSQAYLDAINRCEIFRFLMKPVQISDLKKTLEQSFTQYEKGKTFYQKDPDSNM